MQTLSSWDTVPAPHACQHTHSHTAELTEQTAFLNSGAGPTLGGRGNCTLSLSLSPKPLCAKDSPRELENADASALFQWVVFGPSNLHSRAQAGETGPVGLSALSGQALLTLALGAWPGVGLFKESSVSPNPLAALISFQKSLCH